MDHDDYEKKYMGGGAALASSRAGMPWWYHAMIVLAAAGSTSAALAWVLFMVLRVTVTPDLVNIQLGVFGPKIPLSQILSVEIESYALLKYGGWGIRLGIDGSMAYSVPGHGGRGLRIRYRRTSGRESSVWVTTPDPEALKAAIERGRAWAGARGPAPREAASTEETRSTPDEEEASTTARRA